MCMSRVVAGAGALLLTVGVEFRLLFPRAEDSGLGDGGGREARARWHHQQIEKFLRRV